MNFINNNYININISNNTFNFRETPFKPKSRGSAVDTLHKIESVIRQNLIYSREQEDAYSSLSKEDLLQILKQKSVEIRDRYENKLSQTNWFIRTFFSDEKTVNAIQARIDKLVITQSDDEESSSENSSFEELLDLEPEPSPTALPLPDVLTQEVCSYLDTCDIAALAAVSHHHYTQSKTAMLKRAIEFGYQGNDEAEGIDYLKFLFEEVQRAYKKTNLSKVSPPYAMSSIGQFASQIRPENNLRNLRSLTDADLFTIFSDRLIYEYSFEKLFHFFTTVTLWSRSEEISAKMQTTASTALCHSSGNGHDSITRLLLHYGADPNRQVGFRVSGFDRYCTSIPLYEAARGGHVNTVSSLLQAGAAINAFNPQGSTALSVACDRQYLPVVKILLDNGADPNLSQNNQWRPLHNAVVVGRLDIAALLIARGADINRQATGDLMTPIGRLLYGGELEESLRYNDGVKFSLPMLDFLLTNGANPTFPDRYGVTGLESAGRWSWVYSCSWRFGISSEALTPIFAKHGYQL